MKSIITSERRFVLHIYVYFVQLYHSISHESDFSPLRIHSLCLGLAFWANQIRESSGALTSFVDWPCDIHVRRNPCYHFLHGISFPVRPKLARDSQRSTAICRSCLEKRHIDVIRGQLCLVISVILSSSYLPLQLWENALFNIQKYNTLRKRCLFDWSWDLLQVT